jgi:hypothetical protein
LLLLSHSSHSFSYFFFFTSSSTLFFLNRAHHVMQQPLVKCVVVKALVKHCEELFRTAVAVRYCLE